MLSDRPQCTHVITLDVESSSKSHKGYLITFGFILERSPLSALSKDVTKVSTKLPIKKSTSIHTRVVPTWDAKIAEKKSQKGNLLSTTKIASLEENQKLRASIRSDSKLHFQLNLLMMTARSQTTFRLIILRHIVNNHRKQKYPAVPTFLLIQNSSWTNKDHRKKKSKIYALLQSLSLKTNYIKLALKKIPILTSQVA
jgi:hypothetical protein